MRVVDLQARRTLLGLSLLLGTFLPACAWYPVVKEELVEQLQSEQKQLSGDGIYSLGTLYFSNGIEKFRCRNSDGEPVLLTSDKNTELIITRKGTQDSVKMHLDTVFLSENKLMGQRSRIIHSPREIDLDEVEKLEIYAEFPRGTKVRAK